MKVTLFKRSVGKKSDMYYSPTLTSPSNRSRFPRQVTARAATKRAKGALISSLRWRRASMPKCHVEVGGEGEDLAAAELLLLVPVHYTGPAENREEGENELELHNRARARQRVGEPKYDWKGKLGCKAGQRGMTLWVARRQFQVAFFLPIKVE